MSFQLVLYTECYFVCWACRTKDSWRYVWHHNPCNFAMIWRLSELKNIFIKIHCVFFDLQNLFHYWMVSLFNWEKCICSVSTIWKTVQQFLMERFTIQYSMFNYVDEILKFYWWPMFSSCCSCPVWGKNLVEVNTLENFMCQLTT